ncbi:macrolide export protein MacA [Kordia sp. SMS9]|uniref:efflux RND transporter periplasmic adaptor subunit n=1 Tax=Kordia sp. SMS9 TaxID=2282170 RepID=UPI000E0D9FA4|nr:efflux RND transporter periplasmic adaptor subunit [Kordia sp. SMS9]AXG69861.1 macrolide export protein MacA [Kordia sp. SMS9]
MKPILKIGHIHLFFTIIFLVGMMVISCDEKTPSTTLEKKENTTVVNTESAEKVRYAPINTGDFNLELQTSGKAFAKQKAIVKFILNEKINSIRVKNGQKVRKGQVIASQNNESYRNKVIKATEQLERAKIDVEDILIGFNYSLKDSAKIPKTTLNMAKNRGNYNTSISDLNDAKTALTSTTLRAPISGVIANLDTKKYSYPDTTKPFCTIINTSVFQVEFSVLEENFIFLQKGQAIEISTNFSDTTFDGEITEINPTVDENGLIKVRGTFANSDAGILDGMNVNVTIKKVVPNTLFVPKESVVLRDNKQVVFTYTNGKAFWNYVKTSFENSDHIVIEKGLKKGDLVIYEGNINLAHNSSVTKGE